MAAKLYIDAYSLSPGGMGERIIRIKGRKLMGWDKKTLTGDDPYQIQSWSCELD